jgi:hypothetical protein
MNPVSIDPEQFGILRSRAIRDCSSLGSTGDVITGVRKIYKPNFKKFTKNEQERSIFSIFTDERSYTRYWHEPSEENLHTAVATYGAWYYVENEFLHELTLPETL